MKKIDNIMQMTKPDDPTPVRTEHVILIVTRHGVNNSAPRQKPTPLIFVTLGEKWTLIILPDYSGIEFSVSYPSKLHTDVYLTGSFTNCFLFKYTYRNRINH